MCKYWPFIDKKKQLSAITENQLKEYDPFILLILHSSDYHDSAQNCWNHGLLVQVESSTELPQQPLLI